MARLSEQQRRVLEAMRDGIVFVEATLHRNFYIDRPPYYDVKSSTMRALLRRGYIQRYDAAFVDTQWILSNAGRRALEQQEEAQ